VSCIVWYDKAGSDAHPWLIRRTDGTLSRAKVVTLQGLVRTAFEAAGFADLLGGPRGVVVCDDVRCDGEQPFGP
jgi:hypothetical protein